MSGARLSLQVPERSLHSQLPEAGVSHPDRNSLFLQGGLRRQKGRDQEGCVWVTEEGAGIVAWPPLLGSQDLLRNGLAFLLKEVT